MKSIKTFGFAMLAAVAAVLSSGTLAMAAEGEGSMGQSGMIALSAGIAIAGAAFGAAFGQGRAVAAAMESIGRNPNSADRIQTPMIIGIAFIEALAIYALVIAFFLQGKI
jgi:F-type H+-transporting ATPase subunit c